VVTYQRETIATVCEEIGPMLAAHHAETAMFGDELPLDPNWSGYEAIEQAGALRVYTARNPALVGYSVCFVMRSLHRQVLEANEDLLYVLPALRGNGVGVRLMRFVERELTAEGVELLARRSKARADLSIASMLEGMHYTPVETIFARRLCDGRYGNR
jgi:GNAT superfamily N-acetyltransferase